MPLYCFRPLIFITVDSISNVLLTDILLWITVWLEFTNLCCINSPEYVGVRIWLLFSWYRSSSSSEPSLPCNLCKKEQMCSHKDLPVCLDYYFGYMQYTISSCFLSRVLQHLDSFLDFVLVCFFAFVHHSLI